MIQITIPSIPPSLNVWSRMHWSKAAKIKKQWEQYIYYLTYNLYETRNKAIYPLQKAKVRIKFYFRTNARRDIDNMNQKFLLDGLVKAGIIADDSVKVIGQVEVEASVDKQNPRTEIYITRMESEE